MGFGVGFGAFMNGAMNGYSFTSRAKRDQEEMDARKKEREDKERAAQSMADVVQAQQGIKQRVAGTEFPSQDGVEQAGPPTPKVETVIDLDQVRASRAKAMQDIAKAHGPAAAMQLNQLFRQEDERVVRKAATDLLSSLNAGRYGDIPSIYNRTEIGGVMDEFKPGPEKDQYVVRFRGDKDPQTITRQQIEQALDAKNSSIDQMLDRATRQRQLDLTEGHYKATEKHQAATLEEQVRSNKANEGIRRDYYTGRVENQSDANVIRAQGVAARREHTDQLYPDSMFKTKDAVTDAESLDLNAKAAAKRLHSAFADRGFDDDTARAMTMDAIAKAREKSGSDPKRYRAELNGLLEAAAGQKSPPPADAAPVPAAVKPAPSSGINPARDPLASNDNTVPARHALPPVDPLAGMGDEKARKMRAKLTSERSRYEGRPEAAGRIREIDALIERIDRRDY